jgi:L-ascorbate metabolism protein UlaG (beta-lactamase superfamily)
LSHAAPAVTLYYEGNGQVELISSKGTRVLIDIMDPSDLSSPATKNDTLLTTHMHPDHVNGEFIASFPGRQLFVVGQMHPADVVIRGISSSYNEGDLLVPDFGTNVMYVIDMAGLRICHFGGVGQNALTPEQLEAPRRGST